MCANTVYPVDYCEEDSDCVQASGGVSIKTIAPKIGIFASILLAVNTRRQGRTYVETMS